MRDYIAYAGDRTWKHCDTLEEANEWLSQVGGGRVYIDNVRLAAAEAERDDAVQLNNEFITKLQSALDSTTCWSESPVELVTYLIDERDELASRIQEDLASGICPVCRQPEGDHELKCSWGMEIDELNGQLDELTARLAEAEAAHLTDALVQEQLQRELAAAEALLATARETNRRLNARCQLAESAIPSYRKMVALPPSGDGIRFVSGSFGRALLAFECHRLDERLAAAEAERDALLACRHGDQRCFECPDTSCCDNLNEAAKAAGGRDGVHDVRQGS